MSNGHNYNRPFSISKIFSEVEDNLSWPQNPVELEVNIDSRDELELSRLGTGSDSISSIGSLQWAEDATDTDQTILLQTSWAEIENLFTTTPPTLPLKPTKMSQSVYEELLVWKQTFGKSLMLNSGFGLGMKQEEKKNMKVTNWLKDLGEDNSTLEDSEDVDELRELGGKTSGCGNGRGKRIIRVQRPISSKYFRGRGRGGNMGGGYSEYF